MARLKSAWDKLSMRDRALFIRLGVLNGIYDIRAIKGVYNEYHDEDSKENHDYNMAAAIATGFGPNQNKHWPDTFKKSNHPTFSVESIYSTKETPGGTWGPNFKTFEPSDWMINTYGSTPTIEYLLKHDPEVTPVYMGGVLLPEITVTANRFNNGGNLSHKYDGELVGLSLELNNTITSQPITMFELEIPVQPITITDEIKDIYQSQITHNAWNAAEKQFNENNVFKPSYDDFKTLFFNIYGELPDTLLSSQQSVDAYVNDEDLFSLELGLPLMRHHYTKLAANNGDLQNLVNNFNWDYATTLFNANKDTTDIMSRYKSLVNNTLSGLQYYSDYYNSPGFKERLNHFGLYLLYKNAITPLESIISKVNEISFDPFIDNAYSSFIFGLNPNGEFANYGTGAHEAAHHNMVYNTRRDSRRGDDTLDSTSLYYSPYYKNDYTRIPTSILTILKPSNYINEHDAEINESYSDLVKTRALLEKLGIYKSTEADQTFTEEMYDLYLNTEEGKNDRFLLFHDKQQVIDALNLIASNTNTTNPFETSNGTYLAAFGGPLAHKKSGKELGESQGLNYPNLLPEVEVYPKWYDLEWAKRSAAGLSALGTIATYIPHPYAKTAGLIAQVPDIYYDTRSLVSDVKNTDNWVDEGLNTLILDPFFRKKRPLIERLGKGADYLGPFKKINIPLSTLDAVNDGYYAITGNQLSKDVLSLVDNKKSTGGPLYPFSFEKNPFLKTPVVRYDEGGQKQDASNPGGYTDNQLDKNYLIWKSYDPTGGLGIINYLVSQNTGNLARGEENEYWKEYLGLHSAVPTMNPNAHTEWDKQIEGEKKQNGELTSDFYGTTPRMDYNILALADTLMLGNMVRNYAEYDKTYDLPHIETITEAYEQAKNILNNPNQWTYVNGEIPIGRYRYDSKTSETNPLGMLSHFGMKWVPEENALYMHDTYDFPTRVHRLTDIPVRPREMKIRSRINFDPTKGSWLLRNPVNYNADIPIKVTK